VFCPQVTKFPDLLLELELELSEELELLELELELIDELDELELDDVDELELLELNEELELELLELELLELDSEDELELELTEFELLDELIDVLELENDIPSYAPKSHLPLPPVIPLVKLRPTYILLSLSPCVTQSSKVIVRLYTSSKYISY
jgi:hypothetical protein